MFRYHKAIVTYKKSTDKKRETWVTICTGINPLQITETRQISQVESILPNLGIEISSYVRLCQQLHPLQSMERNNK